MNRKAIIIVACVIAAGVVVFVLTSGPGSRSGTTPRSAWTVSYPVPASGSGAVSPTVTFKYTMPKSNAAAASPTNVPPPAK